MKVYLSHAERDVSLARRLRNRLVDAGFEVFWPEVDVLPGDNLALKLGQALESADLLIVLLTPEAGKSTMLRAEVEYALGMRRFKDRLLPVFVGKSAVVSPDAPWILREVPHVTTTANTDFSEVLDHLAVLAD